MVVGDYDVKVKESAKEILIKVFDRDKAESVEPAEAPTQFQGPPNISIDQLGIFARPFYSRKLADNDGGRGIGRLTQ